MMKVRAPAKLILSGEHAIVYGQPALAMTINRYVTATISRDKHAQILFELADLAYQRRLSFQALTLLKYKIKRKYQRFKQGDFSIRNVLHKPFELIQFALSMITDAPNDIKLPTGAKIHLHSDIPIGCGLGSSAATILSVMYAASNFLEFPMTPELLFQLALEAENMQHGYSSGLDLKIINRGGCWLVQNQTLHARTLPNNPFYIVNTGTPQTTTGECVEKVAHYFKDIKLQEEFAAVTLSMDASIHSQANFTRAVKANHQLLTYIGVVPQRVQQFISEVEAFNGNLMSAAKICGAGAIAGNQGGIVLVATEEKELLIELCRHYHYSLLDVTGESRGVHVV